MAKKKRGPYKYDFDKILPEICEEYINSDKSIKEVLEDQGGPSFAHFYRIVFGNSELQEMWFLAEKIKAASLDSDYVEIKKLALIAFHDKSKNANALKIYLDTIRTRRGQLDAKFRDREVKHVVEAGESWREIMTAGRQRRKLADAKIIDIEVAEVVDEPDSS